MEGGTLESPWLSAHPSVCPWTQFCPELFSYSSARTALKFIHVCVHMKLCMCNLHDHNIIGCGIISPWTCKFYWIFVVRSFSPTVLHVHVLLWNLYIMFVYIWSCACAIFITILSLAAELSPLELVNFTKIIVFQIITPTFLQVLLWNLHIMFVCLWSFAYAISMSICP